MKKLFPFVLIATILFAEACNTTSSRIAFRKEKTTLPDETIVYFYRPNAFTGGGVKTVIFWEGKVIGLLPQNGYIPVHGSVGNHALRICATGVFGNDNCKDWILELEQGKEIAIRLVMDAEVKFHIVVSSDFNKLTEMMLETSYVEPSLRPRLPETAKQTLSVASFSKAEKPADRRVRIVFADFRGRKGSESASWLAGSLPDAIDGAMRKKFLYEKSDWKPAPEAIAIEQNFTAITGSDLVIFGDYFPVNEGNSMRIEGKIYFLPEKRIIGSAAVESPLTEELFTAINRMGEAIVAEIERSRH